jgi:hypothetical protein
LTSLDAWHATFLAWRWTGCVFPLEIPGKLVRLATVNIQGLYLESS